MLIKSDVDNPERDGIVQAQKSFILYHDLKEVLDKISDDQAGKVIKALFDWQVLGSFGNIDSMTEIIITPVISQFKRDTEKWESIRNKRVEAGKRGGLAKASNAKRGLAKASNAKRGLANVAVSVNGNVNVTGNVKDKVSSTKVDSSNSGELNLIPTAKPKANPVPYERIYDLYSQKCPSLRQVRMRSNARDAGCKRIWGKASKYAKDNGKDPWHFITVLFESAEQSSFLRGEKNNRDHPNWKADFEFVTRDDSIAKILEGGYS